MKMWGTNFQSDGREARADVSNNKKSRRANLGRGAPSGHAPHLDGRPGQYLPFANLTPFTGHVYKRSDV